MGRLEDLPPRVLDRILGLGIFNSSEDFLNIIALSKPINQSACRGTFAALSLPDDARLFKATTAPHLLPITFNPVSAFIANPQRYAPYVSKLIITDPIVYTPVGGRSRPFSNSNLGLFGEFDAIEEEEDEEAREGLKARAAKDDEEVSPIEADIIAAIMGSCANLEDLVWAGSCPPPDALCEYLAASTARLRSFSYKPPSTSSTKQHNLSKWDAPSLPLLSSLSSTLASLTLTRLSHAGAKSLSLLLIALAEDEASASALENLEINFLWLDDPLCERIVAAGKKLKRLRIGTQGTKLTDAGIVALLEGLESLEEFGLVNVEGRLSKTLWSKLEPDIMPKPLARLVIGIPDTGPAHSWSLDHLQSFHSFPLQAIKRLAIMRSSSLSTETTAPDASLSLRPVPREVLRLLYDSGQALETLECDWWAWSPDDIKVILERCASLTTLKVTFDAPFVKLLALAGSIASASALRKVLVNIPAEHTASPPSSPAVATPGNPLSPSGSPMINRSTPSRGTIGLPASPTTPFMLARRDSASKPSSSSTMYFEPASPSTSFSQASVLTEGSPITSIRNIPVLDPALPLLRDMKKLFKRCTGLHELEWIGRGTWTLNLSVATSPAKTISLANVKVDFVPASLTADADWDRRRLEEESVKWKWSPNAMDRVGQSWEGETAQSIATEIETLFPEKEKEVLEAIGPRSSPAKRRPSVTVPAVVAASMASKKSAAAETPGKPSGKHRRATTLDSASSSRHARPNEDGSIHPSRDRAQGSSPQPSSNGSHAGRTSSDGGSHPNRHRQRAASTADGERRNGGHARPRNASNVGGPKTVSTSERRNGNKAPSASRSTNGANGATGNRRTAGAGPGGTPPTVMPML